MVIKQDEQRDAAIICATVDGVAVPLAIQLGWKPDDIFVAWPKYWQKRSQAYRERVVELAQAQ